MNRSERLLSSATNLWAPPPKLTLTEWAEENFFLSSEAAAETGEFRAKSFQREALDSITDPRVEAVVIMSATQMLKTTAILIGLGYAIDRDPGPALLVVPVGDDVHKFSKIRFSPMVRDCPTLRGKVAESKSRDNQNTLDYKKFAGGHLSIAASGSPGNLAALPIRYLFCDEIDKYPPSAGAEGDPISLAQKRTITFRKRRKMIFTCSPTVAGRSRIAKAYEESDQREFWVPCPHCGEHQKLRWGQVKWNNALPKAERPATAFYECEHCLKPWNDSARWKAVDAGHWRALGVFTGTAGFRISELYSPWRTLGDIVKDFLAKKDDREQLKTFVNTTLCELWAEEGETPEWEKIYARRENYPYNEDAIVPRRALFLTCAVDVQDDRLEYEVVGWGRHKENWSVAYGVIKVFDGVGKESLRTSDPRVWTELDRVLLRDFRHAGGSTMPIMVMTIDTGSRPRPVYDFALRHARPAVGPAGCRIVTPRTVVPIKGSSTESFRVIASISGEDAARKRRGLYIVSIGTGVAKQEIYDNLRLPRPYDGAAMPGYYHFPQYDEHYFIGLCAEKRVQREDGSVVWEKMGRNEPLDNKVYNLAGALLFGIDRMNEAHWQALERGLGVDKLPPEPTPETPTRTPQSTAALAPRRQRQISRSNWLNR